MAAAMDVDDGDLGESSGLGADKAGKKRFEVKKVKPFDLLHKLIPFSAIISTHLLCYR